MESAASGIVKLGAWRYLVISISMVAVVVKTRDRRILEARVAVGSCSAVARRFRALGGELVGASGRDGADRVVRPEDLAPVSPLDDVRGTAEYRMGAWALLVP